jgi:hypothetical protein
MHTTVCVYQTPPSSRAARKKSESNPGAARLGSIGQVSLDVYWDRLHLAYEFDIVERYNRTIRDESNGQTRRNNDYFEPGEIAHLHGGINDAYCNFLESLGYKLTPLEQSQRRRISRQKGGKYCLVLDRVAEDTYWICYLTTFGNARRGDLISNAAGRYFALAFGESEPWPPDFPAVDTQPKWNNLAYIFAVPVLAKGLTAPWTMNTRVMLQAGAMERIKQQITLKLRVRSR